MLLSARTLYAVATELPAGVVAVPLIRNFELDAYYAEFGVGTPSQKEYLKVDTGSPRYSFLDPRNPVCSRTSQPCRTFGTFDNLTSSYVTTIDIFYWPILVANGSEPATMKGLSFRMPWEPWGAATI